VPASSRAARLTGAMNFVIFDLPSWLFLNTVAGIDQSALVFSIVPVRHGR